MRVLFDHQIFSYQMFGGASRYFVELMQAFHAAGDPAFELAVAESPNEYLATAPFYRGVTVRRPGRLGLFRAFARNELATRRAARRHRHDVLHSTFYDPMITRAIGNAKLVVTMHDMTPELHPEQFDLSSWYGRFVTRRWIDGKRMLCLRADAIVAVSENTKRDVVRVYGIDPDRITVTHLGTRLSAEPGAPRVAGLPERYVLFVGTRNTYKNFPLFVEAVAPVVLADRTLGVACIGGGAFTEAELALIAKHGISERVVQRNVAEHELAACYAHAEVFVFPSLHEGFGIPVVEALACNCPAVLADASCFPEIAGDAAIYFDPARADSLTAAL
ncbi:MAG: glycosyltransferase family 1 protein, partial [Kofleriaceae bacterium]